MPSRRRCPVLDPFDLPDDHAAKSADDLIAADRAHLRRLGAALSREQDALTARLALVRRQAADAGVTAVDRDLEIRRLSATLRLRERDYWDEALSPEGLDGAASLDDQSAFLASLDAHRTGRMRDVLATIQADQDAIVRAPSPGALV
ncbi:unnamed protein product, partial [Penicillium discolor]